MHPICRHQTLAEGHGFVASHTIRCVVPSISLVDMPSSSRNCSSCSCVGFVFHGKDSVWRLSSLYIKVLHTEPSQGVHVTLFVVPVVDGAKLPSLVLLCASRDQPRVQGGLHSIIPVRSPVIHGPSWTKKLSPWPRSLRRSGPHEKKIHVPPLLR
jgi:hypothetical protein